MYVFAYWQPEQTEYLYPLLHLCSIQKKVYLSLSSVLISKAQVL